jgi:hypothetical protein
MKKTAVTILVLWWRRMKKIPLSRRLANMDKVFFFALCHLILCSREGLSANDLCFHCRPCAEHDDNNIIQHVLRREFLEHKLETMQEVEDLQGMTVKIHKVSSHMKEIERNLEQVAQHLWTSEEYSSMEQVLSCSHVFFRASLGDLQICSHVPSSPCRFSACLRLSVCAVGMAYSLAYPGCET